MRRKLGAFRNVQAVTEGGNETHLTQTPSKLDFCKRGQKTPQAVKDPFIHGSG